VQGQGAGLWDGHSCPRGGVCRAAVQGQGAGLWDGHSCPRGGVCRAAVQGQGAGLWDGHSCPTRLRPGRRPRARRVAMQRGVGGGEGVGGRRMTGSGCSCAGAGGWACGRAGVRARASEQACGRAGARAGAARHLLDAQPPLQPEGAAERKGVRACVVGRASEQQACGRAGGRACGRVGARPGVRAQVQARQQACGRAGSGRTCKRASSPA
jgi:hypothetical protein